MFEVVTIRVGGKIKKAGWATKAELDRFTQTANSAQAIGDVARHAHARYQPPQNPMTLAEARSMIARIVKKWIASK